MFVAELLQKKERNIHSWFGHKWEGSWWYRDFSRVGVGPSNLGEEVVGVGPSNLGEEVVGVGLSNLGEEVVGIGPSNFGEEVVALVPATSERRS
jgi:hypothetical protein